MVSGFLISPNDHDRIFSGLATAIWIWSNASGAAGGANGLTTSWFIVRLQGLSATTGLQEPDKMGAKRVSPPRFARGGKVSVTRPPARAPSRARLRWPAAGPWTRRARR